MSAFDPKRTWAVRFAAQFDRYPFRRSQIPAVIDFENRRSPKPLGWAMRRRSRASSKPTKARSRKAKTLKAVRHSSSSASGQETEVARLTRELHEAQDQQRTTSEILGVVARSRTNVQSVLDTVCQSAAQLCEAYDAAIWRPNGDQLLLAAHYGPITQIESVPLVRGTVLARSILDKRTIHIADFQSE